MLSQLLACEQRIIGSATYKYVSQTRTYYKGGFNKSYSFTKI